MFCTRCQQDVPEFLWQNNDHNVMLGHPSTFHAYRFPDKPDEMRITVHAYVSVQKCSEAHKVIRHRS